VSGMQIRNFSFLHEAIPQIILHPSSPPPQHTHRAHIPCVVVNTYSIPGHAACLIAAQPTSEPGRTLLMHRRAFVQLRSNHKGETGRILKFAIITETGEDPTQNTHKQLHIWVNASQLRLGVIYPGITSG